MFEYTDALVVSTFPPGFVPISRCKVQDGGTLTCSQITDASCDHSMDLRVVCRTYQQVYNELLEQRSSTDPTPTCPTCEEVKCPTNHPTVVNESNFSMDTFDTVPRVGNCASTSALGGVVGVLLTLVVVLVIGWSLSCVALVKRNSTTQKQTQ